MREYQDGAAQCPTTRRWRRAFSARPDLRPLDSAPLNQNRAALRSEMSAKTGIRFVPEFARPMSVPTHLDPTTSMRFDARRSRILPELRALVDVHPRRLQNGPAPLPATLRWRADRQGR